MYYFFTSTEKKTKKNGEKTINMTFKSIEECGIFVAGDETQIVRLFNSYRGSLLEFHGWSSLFDCRIKEITIFILKDYERFTPG